MKQQVHFSNILFRVIARSRITAGVLLCRRPLKICNKDPYISFTFDDFPRSALHTGGDILSRFGLRATYYASLGLMGTNGPTGDIFTFDDIKKLFAHGNELGCHTFDHCHSFKANSKQFEESIIKNKRILGELVPGAVFRSFSYPLDSPHSGTKRVAGRYFQCCRAGGQTFNAGTSDLSLLKSYFLEHSRNNICAIKEVIENNSMAKGWLIFTTHDIAKNPTRYGCSPTFFEDIVKYSFESGAKILPVADAFDAITKG